jgi:hypothetical protein
VQWVHGANRLGFCQFVDLDEEQKHMMTNFKLRTLFDGVGSYLVSVNSSMVSKGAEQCGKS